MTAAADQPGASTQRLSKRLLLANGAILLAASITFIVFLGMNGWREWQNNAGAFAQYLAQAIALDITESLLTHDSVRLNQKLDAIGHADMVSLACIYDLTGPVAEYARAARSRPGKGCPHTQNEALKGHLHALETVYQDSTPIGYVTVHMDSDVVFAETLERIGPVLLAQLFLIALMMIAIHAGGRRVTRSLTALTEFARSTTANTADFPRISDAPMEVIELADAYRRLVQHLVQARETASMEADNRRAAQYAESAARRTLQIIANSIPHVMITRRADGSLIFVNRAAASLYGTTVEAMVEPCFLDRVPINDALLIADSAAVGPREIDFMGADGASHRLVVSRNFIEGSDFELTLALDITDVHRLQTQLHFAQRLETVGTLASGIAHDFNNLLTPILGYSTLLESMDIPQDIRERLAHITTAATRARNVVQQILTFSRSRPPQRSRVAIRALVDDTVALMRATVPAHILFRVDQQADVTVYADQGQIEQVLVNLLTNASQAIGTKTGEITIRTWLESAAVAVSIADTGEGMSVDVMSHIFEPFFTTKGVGEGSGLGLSVVHGIVQTHDGTIDVKSTPGEGTVFTVRLPVTDPGTTAAASASEESPNASAC
jgi:signal transduction histidine kinase/uncharacterized membrane protein affecting hemolysin expression